MIVKLLINKFKKVGETAKPEHHTSLTVFLVRTWNKSCPIQTHWVKNNSASYPDNKQDMIHAPVVPAQIGVS